MGVAINSGLGEGSFKSGPFLYRNIEHKYKTKYLYWYGGNLSYTSMMLYIKTARMTRN